MQGALYQKPSHRPYISLTLLSLLALIVYLAVFWPTLTTMELIWRNSETYMHSYLIIPISLWLIWRQRLKLATLTIKPTLLPSLLSVPVLILWLMAYAINVNFASQFAAIIYLQLMLWSLLGHQVVKAIWFPLAFLIFLVPFGEAAHPILQQITADLVVFMLHAVDLPVFREGLYLYTASAVFEVAVACSGLNFLLTSLMLSCLFSYLHYEKWQKWLAFIILVLGLSIIANGIRAFLLVYIGETTNLAYGFGADHYYYGWLVFFIVIFTSFHIGARFADPEKTNNIAPAKHVTIQTLPKALLPLLFVPLLVVSWSSHNLAVTAIPESPAHVLTLSEATAVDKSNWGIQFYDGLTRDHWRLADGTEIFQATYAHRQDRGDMLTWHNRLFDINFWTISKQQTMGSMLDNYQIATLSSISGEAKTLIYWYELGNVKTSNRALTKLGQLFALLSGSNTKAQIKAILISDKANDSKIAASKRYLHEAAAD